MIVPVFEGPWDQDPSIDVWRRRNIDNARVYGAEVQSVLTLGDHVTIEGGYTYTDNEDKDAGRSLPYAPGSVLFGRVSIAGRLASRLNGRVFVDVRSGFGRKAWNWKPAPGVAPDNPDGLITDLADYTKLDAGVAVSVDSAYEVFVKVENLMGEDIENLDDAYTVLDGQPFFRVGVRYSFPLGG
jgi:outer membrane receptor for ferrienterochelin and colicin